MHLLISPTAFKGTLTPFEAADRIARVVRKKYPTASLMILPLADGGDGTLEVLGRVLKGKKQSTLVEGPLGAKIKAEWSLLPETSQQPRTAVIEMARASGLALVVGRKRIMEATSIGTGQLIKAALNKKCRRILLGVGGTACAEGGAGALQALGLRYFDKAGKPLSAQPNDLLRLDHVNWEKFDPRLRKTEIVVLCDVTNPLLGARGSARTFGPQKGATPSQVLLLEKILKRWSGFARRTVARKPGAGAAGAIAFGLAGFAGAKLVEGTSFIMNALQWQTAANVADYILTGEGRLDKTSFQGKVIGEIARRRGQAKIVVICGSSTLPTRDAQRAGIFQIKTLKEFS